MINSEESAGEQPTERAPRERLLRPYLPDRRTLTHLCSGSGALTRRIWDWTTADGIKPFAERLGMVGGAGYMAIYLDRHVTPFIAPGIAGAWCLAALALSRHDHTDQDADDEQPPEDDAGDEPEETVQDREVVIREALLRFIEAITRDRNGIHLHELHNRLAQIPSFASLPRTKIGALLEAYQVPIVRSLTVDGVSGRTGVRRADVLALLRSPDVEAGQSTLDAEESADDQQVSGPALVDSLLVSRPALAVLSDLDHDAVRVW